MIFAGIGVLLLVRILLDFLCAGHCDNSICQAAKDAHASQAVLIDLFSRMENFFKRLESYTEVSPTPGMRDIIIKIMVEVLMILGIATKETKQSRSSEPIDISQLFWTHF